MNNEQQLFVELAEIKTKLHHMDTKLDKLEYAIYGNGKPGLQERTRLIEENQKRSSTLVRTVFGAVVVTAVSGAGWLLYQVVLQVGR